MRAKALIAALIVALPVFALAREVSPRFNTPKDSLQERSAVTYNSQTVALLSYESLPVSYSSRGGGSVDIVDTSALKSNQESVDSTTPVAASKGGNISVYVVQEGDSLSEIAEMFNISTNTIIWANDLNGHSISPSQQLLILPMSGVRHLVEEGDTIESLAKKYNGDPEKIRDFNGLGEDDILAVGSSVNIPDGEVKRPVARATAVSARSSSSTNSSWLIAPLKSYRKTQGIHGYNAVDLAAPQGSAIMAAASGTVVTAKSSGWNGGYGNYVVIRHSNGVQTLYSHFGAVLVSPGQEVVQGQVLGYIGMTGKTTGPHVHFEVRGATNPF